MLRLKLTLATRVSVVMSTTARTAINAIPEEGVTYEGACNVS